MGLFTKTYRLALETGGIPEQPDVALECVMDVRAKSLREAKQKWAEKTNHVDEYWDPYKQTYWGWRVVRVNGWCR